MPHVDGAGDIPNPSLAGKTEPPEGIAGNNGHSVRPTDTTPQLNGLAPGHNTGMPIGKRDVTPVDGAKPTPGLSGSTEDKDLPTLEQEREKMFQEAGELMQKKEELIVLGHALQSLQPHKYEDKLPPLQGLKITLQMSPDEPVYSIEPPDDAFRALPEDQQKAMKEKAYDLLMNHATAQYVGYDQQATKNRIDELKDKLERNGEEIGKKNGDNNWRGRFTSLEQRPAYIVVNSENGKATSHTTPKAKGSPQVTVTLPPQPPADVDDAEEPEASSVSSNTIPPLDKLAPPETYGGVTLVTGDITKLKDQWNIEADGIVNAANKQLQEGSGVCGDIFAAVGEGKAALEAECRAHGSCPTGEVRTTNAFGGLKDKGVKRILHAVAPEAGAQERNTGQMSLNTVRGMNLVYKNIMEEAHKQGLKTVAIPVMGAGAYGVPGGLSVDLAAGIINEYQQKIPGAPKVVFVFYSGDPNCDTLRERYRAGIENQKKTTPLG